MAYKLAHTDLAKLDGKSGKFEVSDRYVVFKARDGSVHIIATRVINRPKVEDLSEANGNFLANQNETNSYQYTQAPDA